MKSCLRMAPGRRMTPGRRMMSALRVLAPPMLGLFLLPIAVKAEPSSSGGSASSSATAERARDMLATGQHRDAISLLKSAIGDRGADEELRWLLTRAYLMEGNQFWALRTLGALLESNPDDCEPLLWMAFIFIQQGSVTEARDHLMSARCPSEDPSETRRMLLLTTLEEQSGEHGIAAQHLASARRATSIYEEDRVVMDRLTSSLDPGYLAPFVGRFELVLGGTSNARAGSPVDPAALGRDAPSASGQPNLWLRFVGPTGRLARPSAEIEARSLAYSAEAARDLTYLAASLRPGVVIGGATPTALLAYRFDTLLLAGGDRYEDGPLWFYEAHRAEFELSLQPSLSLFGGAGRRLFREVGRSRTEADGGLGGGLMPIRPVRLLGALTARWHGARKKAYDLWGASTLASAEFRLPKDWSARAGALLSLDWYPHAEGYFDASEPDTKRRDVLVRLSASGFSPPVLGMKAGATYEYAARFSTTAPYSYREHRMLLKVAWTFSADPWAPRAVSPPGHVPLAHEASSSGFDERIQDLLRQDEATQRSSSCVE